MKRSIFVLLCLSLMITFSVFAEDSEKASDLSFGLSGVRTNWMVVPTGLDLNVSYTGLKLWEGRNTVLYTKFGGGYQEKPYSRDVVTGDPLNFASTSSYQSPNFQWDMLFIQGLIGKNSSKNLLECFAGYRGRFDAVNGTAQSEAVFQDINMNLGTSFILGLSLNGSEVNSHQIKSGVEAELSGEIGPVAVNPIGKEDFYRVTGKVSGFLPVIDFAPDSKLNVASVLLCGRLMADYSDGSSTPIYVNQSFGGKDLTGSVGDVVRGYEWASMDTKLKAVANAELRVLGPSLFDISNVMPILFGFFDAGYYSGYAKSTNMANASGFVMSAGGGFAVNLFGFAQVTALVAVPFSNEAPKPFEIKFGPKFFLHF